VRLVYKMSIIELKRVIQEGDSVLLYGGREHIIPLKITRGTTLNTKWGSFLHNSLIGVDYGSRVYSMNNQGWMYALAPTAELWSRALTHRTQILYIADISLIIEMLELKPGLIVLESGTGSGALSTAIARTIHPTGKLFTFEYHEKRCEAAREDFKRNKLDEIISITCRDVCREGFQMKEMADAVFLDLPSPWEVVQSAFDALIPSGNFCSFSPCIEQVQKTCESLRASNFFQITTLESLIRNFDVRPMNLERIEIVQDPSDERELSRKRGRESTEDNSEIKEDMDIDKPSKLKTKIALHTNEKSLSRPFNESRGHTGFLTFAKKPP